MATNASVNFIVSAVDQASKVITSITNRVTSGFSAAQKALDKFNTSLEGKTNLSAAMSGIEQVSRKMTDMLTSPITAAATFESAMADVNKVVEFKEPDGLKNFGNDLIGMSKKIPLTAEGLAAIAASGGQLGVSLSALPNFTKITAKMSTAFDMLPEKAGDAMAKVSNVFELKISEMERVGDAVNQLSNTSAAKANEIMEVLQRTGGNTKLFGLTAIQTSALSTAFLSLGKSPEVAATGINAMMTKLMTATKGSKEFQGALKEMDISAEDLEKSIGKDAQGALSLFLKRLERIQPSERMKTLVDLFGNEYSDDIAALVGGITKYDKALVTLGDQSGIKIMLNDMKLLSTEQKTLKLTEIFDDKEFAAKIATMSDFDQAVAEISKKFQFAGSMQKEFDARSATTANSWILFKNRIHAVSIEMGTQLLPIAGAVLNKLGEWIDASAEWVKQHSALIRFTLISIAVFGGFLLAISSFGSAVSVVISSFATIRLAIALLFSPIGLLASTMLWAALQIYKHWDAVAAFFSDFASGLRAGFAPLLSVFAPLGNLLSPLIDGFKELISPITYSADALKDFANLGYKVGFAISSLFGNMIEQAAQGLKNLNSFFDLSGMGQALITTFAAGVRGAGQVLWDSILSIFNFIDKLFPHSPADEGPLSQLLVSGKSLLTTFAAGAASGVSYLWQKVKDAFTYVTDKLQAFLNTSVGKSISGAFSGAYNLLTTTIGNLWQGIKDAFGYVFGKLTAFLGWVAIESIVGAFKLIGNLMLSYMTLPLDALNNLGMVIIGSSIFAAIRAYFTNSQALTSSFAQLKESTTGFGVALIAMKLVFSTLKESLVYLWDAVRNFNFASFISGISSAKQAILGFRISSIGLNIGFGNIWAAVVLIIPYMRAFLSTLLQLSKFMFVLPVTRTAMLIGALASSFSLLRNAGGFFRGFFGLIEPMSKSSINALGRFKSSWSLFFSDITSATADRKMIFDFFLGIMRVMRLISFLQLIGLVNVSALVGSALQKIGVDFSVVAAWIRDTISYVVKGIINTFVSIYQWLSAKPANTDLSAWDKITMYFSVVSQELSAVFYSLRDMLADAFLAIGKHSLDFVKALAPVLASLSGLWVWFHQAGDVKNFNAFINILRSTGFIARAATISSGLLGVLTYTLVNFGNQVYGAFTGAIDGFFNFLTWLDTLPEHTQKAMRLLGIVVGIGLGALLIKFLIWRRKTPIDFLTDEIRKMCKTMGGGCSTSGKQVGMFQRLWAVIKAGIFLPFTLGKAFISGFAAIYGYIGVLRRLYAAQQAGHALKNLPWITRMGLGLINLSQIIYTKTLTALTALSARLMAVPWIASGIASFKAMLLSAWQTASGFAVMLMTRLRVALLGVPWIASGIAVFQSALSGVVSFISVYAMKAFAMLRMGLMSVYALAIANPVTAIIVAVVALGAAAYWVYNNWGKVSAFFGNLWQGITGYFQQFVSYLNNVFPGLGSLVALPFQAVGNLISTTFGHIKEIWTAVTQGNWGDVGTALIMTIADGISIAGAFLYDALLGVLKMLRNLLPFSPAKEGPLSDIDVSGTSLITTIADFVLGAGSYLVTAVTSVLGKAWEFISNVNWLELGKGLIFGLIDGIKAIGSALSDAIMALIPSPAEMGKKIVGSVRGLNEQLGRSLTNSLFGDPFAEFEAQMANQSKGKPAVKTPTAPITSTANTTNTSFFTSVSNWFTGSSTPPNTPKYAVGGYVRGEGNGTSDSILARVSNGEFVIPADIVDKFGIDFFETVRSGKMPSFATGGSVSMRGKKFEQTIILTPELDRAKANALPLQTQQLFDLRPPVIAPKLDLDGALEKAQDKLNTLAAPPLLAAGNAASSPVIPSLPAIPSVPTATSPIGVSETASAMPPLPSPVASATAAASAKGKKGGMVVKSHGAVTDTIMGAADKYGIAREDFLRFAAIETGNKFNPDAYNAGSKAKGLFQFIPSSAKSFGIKGKEFDAAANSDAAARMYIANQKQMKRFGIETNAANMYLAHQQGVGGLNQINKAAKGNGVLSATSRRNIMSNVDAKTKASFAGMSDQGIAQAFLQSWQDKFNAIDVSQVTGEAGKPIAMPTSMPTIAAGINAASPKAPMTSSAMPPLPSPVASATAAASAKGKKGGMVVKSHGAVTDTIMGTADKYGIAREDFLRFAAIETGNKFNPDAYNAGSKAKGLFQFIPSSAKAFGIQGREFDAGANSDAAARMYVTNQKQMKRFGIETNAANMYLAHQQGVGGLNQINKAAQGRGVLSATSRRNIMSNVDAKTKASFAGMSDQGIAQAFLQSWQDKFNAIDVSQVTGEAGKPIAMPPTMMGGIDATASKSNTKIPATTGLGQMGGLTVGITPQLDANNNLLSQTQQLFAKNPPEIAPKMQNGVIGEMIGKLKAVSLPNLLKNPKTVLADLKNGLKEGVVRQLDGFNNLFQNPKELLKNPQAAMSQIAQKLQAVLPESMFKSLGIGNLPNMVGGLLGKIPFLSQGLGLLNGKGLGSLTKGLNTSSLLSGLGGFLGGESSGGGLLSGLGDFFGGGDNQSSPMESISNSFSSFFGGESSTPAFAGIGGDSGGLFGGLSDFFGGNDTQSSPMDSISSSFSSFFGGESPAFGGLTNGFNPSGGGGFGGDLLSGLGGFGQDNAHSPLPASIPQMIDRGEMQAPQAGGGGMGGGGAKSMTVTVGDIHVNVQGGGDKFDPMTIGQSIKEQLETTLASQWRGSMHDI